MVCWASTDIPGMQELQPALLMRQRTNTMLLCGTCQVLAAAAAVLHVNQLVVLRPGL